ncbi:TonB-dependent siderophore receptor [Oleiharenicola lentus]|uniref:TonB-dependent siderophore receptor n=1 Tax=Oleiharenicola lentus TaxID=2508720 RepID=UPI003F66C7F5
MQSPAGPVAPVETEKNDDTVVLSPFTVTSERDVGFAAGSTYAGGRLATDLKDTPVAYSVINQEFIEALGLTDLSSAAEWTTNTFKFPDGAGGGDLFNITVPIAVRGALGVSGLRQRNFFIYFSENDSYNIERFDFGRGPNQVLFGNGTVGGTQVSMTKRAKFNKPFETLELGYGSWDNKRLVVDVNAPLNKRFALRTSLLLADRDGWRDGESENRKAAFLTGTYKITDKTELRLEGEAGRTERRIPDAKLNDRLGGWNGSYSGGYLTTAQFNALPNGPLGINRNGANYFVYNPVGGSNAVMHLTDWVITKGSGDGATTPAGNLLQVGQVSWNQTNATILNAQNVVPNRFDRALANSKFFIPDREFSIAPNVPLITSDFRDIQGSLSHQVGRNLFLEIAGDVNEVENDINRIESSSINTYVDINPTLPGGQANPNYLRPYGDGQFTYSNQTLSAKSVRVAAAYILDLDKWGNYSFNLMAGLTNQLIARRNRVLASGSSIGQMADPRQWATDANALRQRFYWGDNGTYKEPTGPIAFVDNLGNAGTVTPTWVPWAGGADSSNNISDNENDYNYALAAMNAKFFGGRLVLLGAARYDDSKQQVRYLKRIGDFPDNWDLSTLYWRPDAPSDWASLTYTPIGSATSTPAITRPRTNNANGIAVPTAGYSNVRFADDFNPPAVIAKEWTPSTGAVYHITKNFSVFGNYAKAISFNTSAAPDVNGRLLPAVEGKGWDAGVRLNLFNNRINLSVQTYSNEEFGNYIDPTAVTNQINTLYQANALGDTTTGGRNTRNAADINGLVRDTRTRVTEGYELELVANMTRNWRAILNVGLPDNTESGYAPMTRAYVDSNGALFRQILDDAGGTVGSDGLAVRKAGVIDTGATPAESLGNEAQRAVNAYNAIYANVANFVVNSRPTTSAPDNVNVFTDYRFSNGKLKGLKLGAGVNWRGSRVVGYRGGDSIVNPANPLQSIDDTSVDGYTTVVAPGASLVTATVGYTWKLKGGRQVDLNLRISNLLDEDDVIWTDTTSLLRPKGGDFASPARETVYNAYAYQIPRSYYLTAKFTF